MKDEKIIEAFQFFQDATYKDKWYLQKASDKKQFAAGNAGMITGKDPLGMSDMKYEWDYVPMPAGPKGDKTPAEVVMWGIPTGAKNPEGAAAWIYQAVKSSKNLQNDNYGRFYNEEQLKRLYKIDSNTVVGIHQGFSNFTAKINQMMTAVSKGNSVITTIENNIPVLQAEIDSIMN